MNRKYLYPILIIIVTIALYYGDKYADKQTEEYPTISSEGNRDTSIEFSEDILPSSTTLKIVEHVYYTLSYSENHEQAEWVAYELKKSHLSKNDFERPYFVEDRSVMSKSADWRNYKNSGYDKGHLCPAGDRRFTYDAFHETFLTSNISPQNHEFNAGIWNRLEQKTRFWAEKFDGVYVITGGVLSDNLKSIGEENVSVPEYFYKIIVDKSRGTYKTIAFLLPNKSSNKSFYDYVVSIDKIEEKTGIDFFPKLSKEAQKKIEKTINIDNFKH